VQDSGIRALQENIMNALYTTPNNISLILSDVCEMIARDSFNNTWPSFVPDLIEGLKQDDPVITMRVLRTFSPVLMKIRNSYRSDDLYTQINYVIENFAASLTE
jgi:exportin-2 (importin alpha re-exporter)